MFEGVGPYTRPVWTVFTWETVMKDDEKTIPERAAAAASGAAAGFASSGSVGPLSAQAPASRRQEHTKAARTRIQNLT